MQPVRLVVKEFELLVAELGLNFSAGGSFSIAEPTIEESFGLIFSRSKLWTYNPAETDDIKGEEIFEHMDRAKLNPEAKGYRRTFWYPGEANGQRYFSRRAMPVSKETPRDWARYHGNAHVENEIQQQLALIQITVKFDRRLRSA